jgi:tetratricopeptide (TPR) repeat protein
MAKKKTTRKQLLKAPDEFWTLLSRSVQFLSTHLQALKYIGVGVGVAAVLYLAAYGYLGHVNEKGQEAYNEAYHALRANLKPDAKTENLKEAEELFRKVIEEKSLSKAADLAWPQLAHIKFLNGEYTEAIDIYERFLNEVEGQPKYESLARIALAGCYEAEGELQAAVEVVKPLLKNPRAPLQESAQWILARLYRLDNQTQKAKQLLEEFVAKYPASPFAPIAKTYL